MRKAVTLTLLLLLMMSAGLVAQEQEQEQELQLEPLMAPGDLAVTAGLGYGFFWGAIDLSGGVELMLSRVDIGDTLPITFGIAGKANYYRYDYSDNDHYTYLGGGGFATAHFGLKDLNLDENMRWLANVDTYVGLGLGFYSYAFYDDFLDSTSNDFKIGLRSTAGVNYFLTPNIAITAEGGYYGYWSGGLIGILFKF